MGNYVRQIQTINKSAAVLPTLRTGVEMNSKRPFYGWFVVFLSAIGLFLGPPLMVFSFGVFFKPMVENFHASRAAVSLAFSIFNFVGAVSLPFTGVIIDRFGAKRVILVFTFLYGLCLCSAFCVGDSLWQLYLFFTLTGIAMASGPAPVPHGVVISHWFNRHRGFALGLSMMGIGIGSIVIPIIAQRLITMFGWRGAFAIFGSAVLLVPLPIMAAWLQNDPAQRGLQPDGDPKPLLSNMPSQSKLGLSWREIWHSPTFWLLTSIFCLAGVSVHGAALHMAAIFTDRGVSAARAATATSLLGAAVIVGRVGSGYLLDRFFAPRVAIFFYGATALGLGILCTGVHGTLALFAAFLTGLGMGAEVESMGYLISRYFGLAAFGTSYSVAFSAFMIAGSVGVLLMGAGYDHFHSYMVPLASLCVAMVLTLILLTRLGPYRYGVEAESNSPMNPMEVPTGAQT
jgi:MFS family permease